MDSTPFSEFCELSDVDISHIFCDRDVSSLDEELFARELSSTPALCYAVPPISITSKVHSSREYKSFQYNSDTIVGNVYCISGPCGINYVGSTLQSLKRRWRGHLRSYQKWLAGKGATVSIFEYFSRYDIANFSIRLLKSYQVVDRKHLFAYETLWINSMKTVNVAIPFAIRRSGSKQYRNSVNSLSR